MNEYLVDDIEWSGEAVHPAAAVAVQFSCVSVLSRRSLDRWRPLTSIIIISAIE